MNVLKDPTKQEDTKFARNRRNIETAHQVRDKRELESSGMALYRLGVPELCGLVLRETTLDNGEQCRIARGRDSTGDI